MDQFLNPPVSLSEWREVKQATENSEDYRRALIFTQEIRKTVKMFDKGLLTPGDVLFQVLGALTEWAGE